jgi:quinol monooxygenase YgiN
MILITAKANVSNENRVAYLKLCTEQVENSRKKEGCIDYGFFEDAMSQGSFVFIERWKDQAALDFHFNQSYCIDFIRSVRKLSLATSPIEIHHIAKTEQP